MCVGGNVSARGAPGRSGRRMCGARQPVIGRGCVHECAGCNVLAWMSWVAPTLYHSTAPQRFLSTGLCGPTVGHVLALTRFVLCFLPCVCCLPRVGSCAGTHARLRVTVPARDAVWAALQSHPADGAVQSFGRLLASRLMGFLREYVDGSQRD